MIAEFSIFPVGEGESLSGEVARVIDKIDRSGLPYRLTPMGTIVEGEPKEIFDLILECHMLMRESHGRIATNVKIDDRVGKSGALESKIASIEKKLGREMKK